MRKLIFLIALVITTLTNAQTVSVENLLIKNQVQNTTTTRALVVDPVTKKVGWNTFPTSYTPVDVSASVSGIVNNTSLQELGGVDKLINDIRVGKGGGNIVSNTVVGNAALTNNTTGFQNSIFGANSFATNTAGRWNNSFGYASLRFNTTGDSNNAFGVNALGSNTIGYYNCAFGDSSLSYNTEGTQNTAFGTSALQRNILGFLNTGVGYQAGQKTTGNNNTAVGAWALQQNLGGNSNIALGASALQQNTTGSFNIVIGESSGIYYGPSGLNNRTTGDNGIYIGANIRPFANAQTNEIIIGHSTVGNGSNTVTLGNSSVTNIYTSGKVNAPSYKVSALNTAPSSATDTGTVGEIRYTATYIYICIATNTWVRAALSTW